jgi:cytochrome c biogenesis protein CcmG/thiol:disulfide interchange protein DsbE
MKKWLSKKTNIFFVFLFVFALFQQIPVLKNNLSRENASISLRSLRVLNDSGTLVKFPPKDSRAIVIFWASWCGPCKIEMARLQESVESGAIPKESLFAVNPFESDLEARKFVKESNYPFTFIEASTLASELDVKVTPTTLFVDKGLITKMSSGMSIWGIWEAEHFL